MKDIVEYQGDKYELVILKIDGFPCSVCDLRGMGNSVCNGSRNCRRDRGKGMAVYKLVESFREKYRKLKEQKDNI